MSGVTHTHSIVLQPSQTLRFAVLGSCHTCSPGSDRIPRLYLEAAWSSSRLHFCLDVTCHTEISDSHGFHTLRSHTLKSHVHSKITHTWKSQNRCYHYTRLAHIQMSHTEITHAGLHTLTHHTPGFTRTWKSHMQIHAHVQTHHTGRRAHSWESLSGCCTPAFLSHLMPHPQSLHTHVD